MPINLNKQRSKGQNDTSPTTTNEFQDEYAKPSSYFSDYTAGRKPSGNNRADQNYTNQYKKYNGQGPPMPTSQQIKQLMDNPPKVGALAQPSPTRTDQEKFDKTDALTTQLKIAKREIE